MRWTYFDELCVTRVEEHLFQMSMLGELELQRGFHLEYHYVRRDLWSERERHL